MPYIKTTANVKIDKAKADSIKAKFGKAIETFPGKSERFLMLAFEPEVPMYFGGSDAPCAMAEVSLFGAVNAEASNSMSAAICTILSEELGIDSARIYVKYSGFSDWGWNGSNF